VNVGSSNNRTLKAYVTITGLVFGLLTLAHVWRIIEEGSHLATDVAWVLITVASAALCVWAFLLLLRMSRH
jgi:dolichyl-phosphate-mannose--protein O-mannosyl transferase